MSSGNIALWVPSLGSSLRSGHEPTNSEDYLVPRLKPDLSRPHYVLEVDALLLTAARSHTRRARVPKSKITPLTNRLGRLQGELDGLDPWEDYDRAESLAIQMEGAYAELAPAYTPVLRLCAQAHINAALAIEAHLNRRIMKSLHGDHDVERLLWLRPVEKLQELLDRRGGGKLGPRESPLPAFRSLVKTRNALVHYRPRRLPVPEVRAPRSPRKLGLEPGLAKQSVRTAEHVIAVVSRRLGDQVPSWVARPAWNVFSYEFE